MPIDVESLLAADGPIARKLEHYEPRTEQMEMARAVHAVMASRSDLIVEAGTGVGKSFGYLLPAIRRIVDHGEKVVIATNTIALQEQLVDKDIPLLSAVIPDRFSAVLVKGRNNYLSLRRLELASERRDKLFASADAAGALDVVIDWAYDTEDGTRSTLPVLDRADVWDQVQSDAHNCMGRRCPTFDKCFYQTARKRMQAGDLLVCNHALFFADLALRARGVGFLPPYHHVVIDEAHCAEDVAAEHFGLSVSEARVAHLLNLLYQPRARRGFLESARVASDATGQLDTVIATTLRCRDLATALFDDLHGWQSEAGPPNGRIDRAGIVPNGLTPAMHELRDVLKLLRPRMQDEADRFELASYAQRADDIGNDLDALLQQRVPGGVYFLEQSGRGRRGRRARLGLHCRVVEIGGVLAEHLFDKDQSVTLTSATLATLPGDFTHVAGRLGCPASTTLQLGSPFDHASQMRVIVDVAAPDPRQRDYLEAICPRILQSIEATDGGAFVLFTSFLRLRDVAERLRPELEADGHPVLAQGTDGAPGPLLARFRQDDRSVLFGTTSFWQGVDVRGHALRNVIITRLPFDVPDRPLIEARMQRIEQRGGRPFIEEAVPRAVIRFKQGIGRLIRSGTDEGRVVILDPRVVTKPYGRAFLAALPEGVEPQIVGLPEEEWTA